MNKNKTFEKMFSLGSVLLLLFAWVLGGQRSDDAKAQFFQSLTQENEQITPVSPTLFKVAPAQPDGESEGLIRWIGLGSSVGYGGDLVIGAEVLPNGDIARISVLSSKETSSYFEEMVEATLPEALVAQNINTALSADAVTGATLTSNAYIQALEAGVDPIRQQLFGYTFSEPTHFWHYFQWLDIAALLFFAAAVWVNKTRSEHKNKINTALLAGATLVFGFHAAALYSVSTMGGLLFGSVLTGVANYTPFILLVLSIGYILYYNRNIYCQSLCPFGAVQQCLAKVGNAKSSPVRQPFFIWLPRVILLLTLCLGAYFRNPAAFVYEPFGIAFGMIGGMYLFILTVLILLTSLVVRRPWCQSLCPINAMTDFVVFNKNWLKQARSQAAKAKRQPRARRGEHA